MANSNPLVQCHHIHLVDPFPPDIHQIPSSLVLKKSKKHISSRYGNPSCEVNPLRRGDLLSGVEINTFKFGSTLTSGLSKGIGHSLGWPLNRGSSVVVTVIKITKFDRKANCIQSYCIQTYTTCSYVFMPEAIS